MRFRRQPLDWEHHIWEKFLSILDVMHIAEDIAKCIIGAPSIYFQKIFLPIFQERIVHGVDSISIWKSMGQVQAPFKVKICVWFLLKERASLHD